MSDPLASSSNDQLLREAKRSLVIVAILMTVLAYVTFSRFTGPNRIPEHVRNAPIARTVWPYANEAPDSASRHAARQAAREMSEPVHEFAGSADFGETNPDISESTNRVEQAEFQDDRRSQPDFLKERGQHPVERNKPSIRSQSTSRDFALLPSNRLPTVEKKKPYPHTSAPLSASHSITSPISVINSKPEPDNKSAHPKKEIAVKTQSDFPLDPFESSRSNAIAAPLNQVGNSETARQAPAPSDFSPSAPQFQPMPVASPSSDSTQDFAAIHSLALREPKLIAPCPVDRPAAKLSSIPSEFTGRTGANSLGSFEASGQPDNPLGKLVAVTNKQTGTPKSALLHRVAEGESYYTIAQHYYGDGSYFRALSHFNQMIRQVDENLKVGTEIEIPKVEQLEIERPNQVPKQTGTIPTTSTSTKGLNTSSKPTKTVAALNPNQDFSASAKLPQQVERAHHSASVPHQAATFKYVTKQGETLFEIAANELGQASRYLEIMEANRERLPKDVTDSSPLPANLKLDIPE